MSILDIYNIYLYSIPRPNNIYTQDTVDVPNIYKRGTDVEQKNRKIVLKKCFDFEDLKHFRLNN